MGLTKKRGTKKWSNIKRAEEKDLTPGCGSEKRGGD